MLIELPTYMKNKIFTTILGSTFFIKEDAKGIFLKLDLKDMGCQTLLFIRKRDDNRLVRKFYT